MQALCLGLVQAGDYVILEFPPRSRRRQADLLRELTWTALNGLLGQLQALVNVHAQFKSAQNQNTFQQLSQHVDSFAYHLRIFDVPYLIAGGDKLEKAFGSVNTELDRLRNANIEIDKVQKEVKALIAPAVAGSLSQAFTERRNMLMWGRAAWFAVTFIVGGACIWATFSFAAAVSDAMLALKAPDSPSQDFVWLSALVRSVILLPLYAAFGFCFAQYKKERDFEEEYAHKAAVATSLPNYGDLAREPAVRDQIVTGATSVIFRSPTKKHREEGDQALGGVKEILTSVRDLVQKK